MQKPTVQRFREIFQPFSDVPAAELDFLIENSRHYTLKEGDHLFRADQPAMEMQFVLAGKIRIIFTQGNQTREISVLEAGDIGGVLPYSRMEVTRAAGIVSEAAEILAFPKEKMPELIRNQYFVTEALVHQMSTRIREFTTYRQQNEKMMALGKLSAGLAHELNNPAAAIVRSSKELKKHLGQLPENFKKVMRIQMGEKEVDEVNAVLFNRLENPPKGKLGLMERQSYEEDLIDCLEENGADEADEIAENLIEFGFSCEDVEMILEKTGADHFPPVIKWVNDNLVTEKMVRDIGEASVRISDLVGSVKNFTHMDRAPEKISADIHEGLENTLTMLNHKARENVVRIDKQFADDLPEIPMYVSELNQVWTNLIDNALDAMENVEDAVLTIKTELQKDEISVKIMDNGNGIPEDIQEKIFEPFYTTKEIGKGTGLGLDVVRNIIEKHSGKIEFKSDGNGTVFEVKIPK